MRRPVTGRIRRALRRAHARWRLHRMEWNALHAPLQPPKGYEHYHTLEASFPGYRDFKRVWDHTRTWADVKEMVRGGWRVYKHSNGDHDPEVAEWLRRAHERENIVKEKRFDYAVKQVKEGVERGKERFEATVETAAHTAQEARPAAESFFKDRAVVLQKAVTEFAEGFKETMSGDKNIWGEEPGIDGSIESLVRNDPVIYKVQGKDGTDAGDG